MKLVHLIGTYYLRRISREMICSTTILQQKFKSFKEFMKDLMDYMFLWEIVSIKKPMKQQKVPLRV
jgi:hypothetical protein